MQFPAMCPRPASRAIRWLVPLLALGCGGETGFSSTPDNTVIEGTASMEYTPDSLAFEEMTVGVAKSAIIEVTNTGDAILRITYGRIVSDDANAYYTDEDANTELELGVGGRREFIIVCELSEDAPALGTFRFTTNDADKPVVDIPMACLPLASDDTGA